MGSKRRGRGGSPYPWRNVQPAMLAEFGQPSLRALCTILPVGELLLQRLAERPADCGARDRNTRCVVPLDVAGRAHGHAVGQVEPKLRMKRLGLDVMRVQRVARAAIDALAVALDDCFGPFRGCQIALLLREGAILTTKCYFGTSSSSVITLGSASIVRARSASACAMDRCRAASILSARASTSAPAA